MGGKGSGRKDRTTELLNNSSVQKFTPIADNDIFIPNHSGDHSAGRVLTTPTTNYELVNKKYVDDKIAASDVFVEIAGDTMTGALIINNLTLDSGSITDSSGAISFGNENLTTTGTLNAGVTTIISDLTLNAGSITSASGAISFGDENLSTTGTLTVTKLEVNDSSLTNATGHISSTSTVWNPKAYGTIGASTLQLSSDVTAGDDNYGASLSFSRIDTEVAKGAAIVAVQTSSDVDNTGLSFFTHPSTSTSTDLSEQMRIEHDGNVGIGTTTPTAVLQVGDTDAILIDPEGTAQLSTLSGNAGGLRCSSGVLTMDSAAAMGIDYNTRGLTGTRDFTIRHDNSAMLTIEGGDNIGNVGIGTATPTTKLDVAGSGLFTGGLLTLGVEDSVQGRLVLHGTATGEGGQIDLKLPGDSDGTFENWVIDVPAGDDLRIFTSDAAVIHTFSNTGTVTFNGSITGTKTSADVEITGTTTNADARLVLKNTGNGRHSGIQLIRERLSGTGVTAASIFVNSDTSTNNTRLIIQCNSSTNIGSLGPTDQRIILDAITDTLDIDNCGVMIQEIASAKADKAGYGQIWVKNTTPCELWFTDDAGTDTQIV